MKFKEQWDDPFVFGCVIVLAAFNFFCIYALLALMTV